VSGYLVDPEGQIVGNATNVTAVDAAGIPTAFTRRCRYSGERQWPAGGSSTRVCKSDAGTGDVASRIQDTAVQRGVRDIACAFRTAAP